jgi:hypothetical protein
MKLSIRPILETVLGLLLVVATVSVSAQTVGAGPYYATPSWDQTLPSNTRFIVLSNMNSEAVLDRETGLVWEKSPDSTPRIWDEALLHCIDNAVGGRKGWRLPSINELASLIDPTVVTIPSLPNGHPFTNIQTSPQGYWSATTSASAPLLAWLVYFHVAGGRFSSTNKESPFFGPPRAWCVRGGAVLDNY